MPSGALPSTRDRPVTRRAHRPFALVFGGGGARGFAHLGVLQALERDGYQPERIVGVSMGALVGVTYATRPDWYEAVLAISLADFPGPTVDAGSETRSPLKRARALVTGIRTAMAMVRGWGPASRARDAGMAELRALVGHATLDRTRIPVVVTATDLRSGQRVVLGDLPACEAVYASAALAGVLPPLERAGRLLADGAYADIAPVDLARGGRDLLVIAVDAGGSEHTVRLGNGYQALIRAMDICHRRHAHLRFAEADLLLRPRFAREVDTLEFSARRVCVAAGLRAVRETRETISRLLREGG